MGLPRQRASTGQGHGGGLPGGGGPKAAAPTLHFGRRCSLGSTCYPCRNGSVQEAGPLRGQAGSNHSRWSPCHRGPREKTERRGVWSPGPIRSTYCPALVSWANGNTLGTSFPQGSRRSRKQGARVARWEGQGETPQAPSVLPYAWPRTYSRACQAQVSGPAPGQPWSRLAAGTGEVPAAVSAAAEPQGPHLRHGGAGPACPPARTHRGAGAGCLARPGPVSSLHRDLAPCTLAALLGLGWGWGRSGGLGQVCRNVTCLGWGRASESFLSCAGPRQMEPV